MSLLIYFSSFVYAVATIFSLCITHWIYRWSNPKCNGVLPPGSMGLPFIGETLQLIIPSSSLDLPHFIKTRIKRYGSIFRTNVAGRPVIVTADREFNYFILQQDEKWVGTWSLDTFAEVFELEKSKISRKYTRNVTLKYFGMDALKQNLIPRMEDIARKTLHSWSNQESTEVKSATITMMVNFAGQQLFSGDLEKAPLKLSDMFNVLVGGLMSFPLNIPGTTHHKCLQIHKRVRDFLSDVVKTRRLSSEDRHHRDLLDHLIQDMNTDTFLDEDFIIQLMFSLLFVTSETISTMLVLSFKLILEHPSVLEELTAEHEAILKKRENLESPLSWTEYKSMTFTRMVINEVLRLGSITPGLFRRAQKDISVNGFTIPKGWAILIATAALHLDSNQFDDPLAFNPWRWEELQSSIVQKNFMPFGVGMKQCAGAEYSRVFLASFLHVLVTEYRWERLKGGKIVRTPFIKFPDGFHFKILARNN